MSFSNLKKKAEYFRANPEYCKTRDGLVDMVCRDCEFWKEDERDYECGALALLKLLLHKNIVSVEDIVGAVSE